MYMFIYQITCNDQIYIGSTVDIRQRYRAHKYCCNKEGNPKYNLPLYKYIRDNGGYDNIKLEIVKIFDDVETLEEQKIIEQKIIEERKPTLNTVSAYQQFKDKKIYDSVRYEQEKVLCPCCNKRIGKYNMVKHKKSKKYLKFINN